MGGIHFGGLLGPSQATTYVWLRCRQAPPVPHAEVRGLSGPDGAREDRVSIVLFFALARQQLMCGLLQASPPLPQAEVRGLAFARP